MNSGFKNELSSAQDQTALAEALNIARAQLARRRPQLGELTHEQEIAIENLMLSTTAKIAGLIKEAQLVIADKRSANYSGIRINE